MHSHWQRTLHKSDKFMKVQGTEQSNIEQPIHTFQKVNKVMITSLIFSITWSRWPIRDVSFNNIWRLHIFENHIRKIERSSTVSMFYSTGWLKKDRKEDRSRIMSECQSLKPQYYPWFTLSSTTKVLSEPTVDIETDRSGYRTRYSQTKKCTTFMLKSIFLKWFCHMFFWQYRVKFFLNILGKLRLLKY